MQEAEEAVVALHETEDLVGGGSKAGVGAQLAQVRPGQHLEHALPNGRRGVREHHNVAEVRVVLRSERRQCLVEPRPWLVHDHHGHDGRGGGARHELGVIHGGETLPVVSRHESSYRRCRPPPDPTGPEGR